MSMDVFKKLNLNDQTKILVLNAIESGDALIWFEYPMKSSKKYKGEFTRDTGWHVFREAGFDPVRMVFIDADWFEFRFHRAEFIKR